jgi:hypothetical protein
MGSAPEKIIPGKLLKTLRRFLKKLVNVKIFTGGAAGGVVCIAPVIGLHES